MFESADKFLQDKAFPSFAHHFAKQMIRLEGRNSTELLLAAGLLCYEMFKGNVAVSLKKYAGKKSELFFEPHDKPISFPDLRTWQEQINSCRCVGLADEKTPLIREDQDGDLMLYLNRYWRYERVLAQVLKEKIERGQHLEVTPENNQLIERLFPKGEAESAEDFQRTAALTALKNPLTVITGGPGTGKTTIVVKILAMLLHHHQRKHPEINYRFRLVAPTGKAASRLKESIIDRKKELLARGLISHELFAAIAEEASTIHRLLGHKSESVYFKHHRDRKLLLDCLIVDEASMVDLALMSKLMEAVPSNAKVILLGDENQLASVEAGSVLRDICLGLREHPVHRRCVVKLTKSYRFSAEQGIGQLSDLVNAGMGSEARKLLNDHKDDVIAWETVSKPFKLASKFRTQYIAHYARLLRVETIEKAFELFERFFILCALRQGPYGIESINRLIETLLIERKLLIKRSEWYAGKPILITSNDYQLNLFNGDIGITFFNPESNDLRIYFKTEEGFRKISPHRLSHYETAYALTVHKSQGSEFDQVFLLLPPDHSVILTKELIYTGITRAKRKVIIMGKQEVFIKAVDQSIERFSGLRHKLARIAKEEET